MLAILQFDAVNLPRISAMLSEGRLPALTRLRERGHWVSLQSPAAAWEGATYYSIYSGKTLAEHGLYYPFMWAPRQQRVRSRDAYIPPEPIWDRIGKAGFRSLVVDPYDGSKAMSMQGSAISGWQFRHKVTLRGWCVPKGLDRQMERRFGRPSLVEEIYGCPSLPYLTRMRKRLLAAPARAAAVTTALLSEQSFDLVWTTFCSAHIAGHWFLDPSRLPSVQKESQKNDLDTALTDAYAGVDDAISRVLERLPSNADLIVLSASGMGPNVSRSHLLPRMLQAVLSGKNGNRKATNSAGNFLWRLRAAVPPDFRSWVARVLPSRMVMEITARLAMRGTDWNQTKAFIPPSGDCGYIRLNLLGRERDGIVDPRDAPALLELIAAGLRTFCDPDGRPAIKNVEIVADSLGSENDCHSFPDLIVHWSEHLPPLGGGVRSGKFGAVESAGWGSGRTGEHCDGAWALIVPGQSRIAKSVGSPEILDIAPTVCSVLGVGRNDLTGMPLLEPGP